MSAEGFARAFPQWSVHEISQVMLTLPHPVDTDSLLSVLCARQVDDVHLAHFLNQDTPIYPFLPPLPSSNSRRTRNSAIPPVTDGDNGK